MNSLLPAPAPRRAALVFIFVTVLLDILALGIIIPVLPSLVRSFLGGDAAKASSAIGVFGTVWAMMQFVFSPILGALSDRSGRRPIILLSNVGLGLDYILMALAPSLSWLFAGRIISGITAASIPTASAYIADVTAPEKRAGAYGLLGAAFGLGFVLGPALGGVLGDVSPRLPFWVAAGFSLANACYGLFVLPESLSKERRATFSWKRANPLGSLKLLRSHPELLGLAGVSFLGYLAHEVLPSVFVLYAGYRYGWSTRTVGLTLGMVGLCSAAIQSVVVRPLVARIGERRTLLIGLFFGAIGFTIYGLATEGWQFWMGLPVMALWGVAGPATQGLMSRRVQPTEQGQLQGATTSLRGVSGMVGPGIYTFIFALFIGKSRPYELPGAPFLLSALFLGVAFLAAWRIARPARAPLDPAAQLSRG